MPNESSAHDRLIAWFKRNEPWLKRAAKDRDTHSFVMLPLGSQMLPQIFTDERVRILLTVRERGPFATVNDLAEALKRDQSRVSHDLQLLLNAGLVKVERHGKEKRISAPDVPIFLY